MGSQREHERAHARTRREEQINKTLKRLISPLPNGRYSLFTYERPSDREYTYVGIKGALEAEQWLAGEDVTRQRETTQADRIMATGRTQPLTPVEQAFFGCPDHMVKPHPETGRVPMNVDPTVVRRLHRTLLNDPRFQAIGYSEFITRTLDALGAE